MHIPIDSPDIRSAYLMDRSGKSHRRFKKDRNPRIERIKDKVIHYLRQQEAQKIARILLFFFLIGVAPMNLRAQLTANGQDDVVEPAWPHGLGVSLKWEFPESAEPLIQGFQIFRSSRTSTNMEGVTGPFSRVATLLSPSAREYKLSAPVGTYVYFVVSFNGKWTSVASNQVRIKFVP